MQPLKIRFRRILALGAAPVNEQKKEGHSESQKTERRITHSMKTQNITVGCSWYHQSCRHASKQFRQWYRFATVEHEQ